MKRRPSLSSQTDRDSGSLVAPLLHAAKLIRHALRVAPGLELEALGVGFDRARIQHHDVRRRAVGLHGRG
jgi:hypothetical protein